MRHDFNSWYLALLRKQVEDEIQFLVKNGHDKSEINERCIFCTEKKSGGYRCYRLNELRRFQSSILQQSALSNQIRNQPKQRRKIGVESTIEDDLPLLNSLESNEFAINTEPLLVLKF